MFKGFDFVRLVKAACKLLEFTRQTEFIEWGPRLFQFGLVRAHGTTFVQARSLRTLLQTVFSTPIKKPCFEVGPRKTSNSVSSVQFPE